MRPLYGQSLVFWLTIYPILPASAQDGSLDPPASRAAILPLNSNSPVPLTGKERLGRKWMDEQRIDNCNVPADKRGARRRPNCPHAPAG